MYAFVKRSRMRRSLLPFALPYCVALLVLGAYWSGADWAFRAVIWTFFAALLADSFIGAGRSPGGAATDAITRALTWPWLLVQAALILTGLLAVTRGTDPAYPFYATAVAIGTMGGMFGIPVAHELMHRRNRFDRFLAEALMTLFSYTH